MPRFNEYLEANEDKTVTLVGFVSAHGSTLDRLDKWNPTGDTSEMSINAPSTCFEFIRDLDGNMVADHMWVASDRWAGYRGQMIVFSGIVRRYPETDKFAIMAGSFQRVHAIKRVFINGSVIKFLDRKSELRDHNITEADLIALGANATVVNGRKFVDITKTCSKSDLHGKGHELTYAECLELDEISGRLWRRNYCKDRVLPQDPNYVPKPAPIKRKRA